MTNADQGAAAGLTTGASQSGQAGAGVESSPGATPAPAQSFTVNPIGTGGASLSADHVAQAFDTWRRAGRPAEDFVKAAAADGYQVALSTDQRSADEIAHDKVFAGAAPDAYKVHLGALPDSLAKVDVVKLDGEIRGALSAMNFSPRIGPAVMENAIEDATAWARLDEGSRALYDRRQLADLGRAVGEDKVSEAIGNARIMLSMMKPELRQELLDAGLFRSMRSVLELHMQCKRWLARADMAEQRAKARAS